MSTMESYLITELCTACTRGDLDNVKRLIELGASPWTCDDQGNTLFHLCCSSVQCGLEVLDYLISVYGIVDCGSLVNNEGSTLLHLACITGKLEFVRLLFVQHQDGFESCHDIHGHTPLYYACVNQHLDIVSFVCSHNIVLSPDNVYHCVKVSTWEIMKLLLKKISFRNFMYRVIEENHVVLANLVIKDNIVQWLDITSLFPLHYSALLGDVKIIKYLINNIKFNIESIDNNGNRPLHVACFSGNVELVRYLVEELGCDINAMGNNDYTSLHWACEKNHLEIVKFLTSKPECNCEADDKNDNRPLHIACLFSGNVELVRYLVEEADCDINAKGSNDNTSLLWACYKNQLEIVKFLTSKPECNRESANKFGNLPLHLACGFSGNVELVRYLVEEAGCDINAKGENDYTSLHWACEKNQLEIVKFLTSKPECNRESAERFGNLPLHIACIFSGNVELVRYLVEEADCDINAKGSNDYTSLHWACEKNQLEIVKFLTSKPECNREAGDEDNNRPLHIACIFSGNVELVRYLVEEADCDINAKGSNDNTSLLWACYKNQLEIVKFLTSKPECNRESANKLGNLPLHLTCGFSGNVELVRYLVKEADCDINAKGSNDYTSLHWACEKNQLEIVKFLTSKPECNCEAGDEDNNRPLHIACIFSGNVELVRYLVEEADCDINAKGSNDNTSLLWACYKNQLEIVKFLTSKPECNRESANKLGNLPLHLTCGFSGNVELVRYLVEEAGCDINAKGENDYTSLHWACEKNQLEIVKFLTSKPECNRESAERFGNLPLHIACIFSGNVELVRYLVEEADCDINAKGSNDNTSLLWACYKDQLEIVKFLTSKPECNRESANKFGNLPLHLACGFSGNVELVRYLVEEAGCDINAKGENDYTSLHWACYKNQLEIVKFLTSKPECNRECSDKVGNQPLHTACSFSGNVELVRYLVEEAGCDINAKGENDYTSLHWACEKNQLEIVKFLTSKPECNRESANKFGNLPLHLACGFSGNVELVRYLVEEAGCDINAKGENDYTSLHWACEKNQLEIVKFLTSKQECSLEAGDKDGNRPLHLACGFSGNVELVRYLVEVVGCDINSKTVNGKFPLKIALNKKNFDLVKYLIARPECHTIALNCNDNRLQRLLDHHNKFQQAIKSTGVTYLRVVKCILTGPPGAGKSTLKKRLLNETLMEPSHSTGVVDSAIQVESFRKLQQEGAIVSGLNENFSKWRKQDSAEEAVFLFERISTNSSGLGNSGTNVTKQSELTKKSIKIEPIEEISDTFEHNTQRIERTELIEGINITISSDIQHSTVCNLEVPEIHNETDSNEVIILDDDNDDDNINTDRMTFQDTSNNSESYVAPNVEAIQTLSETVQSIPVSKRTEYEKRLQQLCQVSHAILHIIDTGGQPEFHEILPALITGPAINLLVFKLTEDLRSRFKITYRSPNGKSQPYETSFTHEEVIFRSLASIACLRQNKIGWTFDELPVKDDSEPAAFLIATHRDCVDESKVSEVNEQLKMKIQNSVELFHENLVQFSNEEQAIFPLDTINDQDQIEHLRTTLHNVISKKFSELPIPVSWCTFSLKLRKSKKSLHKLDTCYKLAKECGISNQDDFKSALWYLHHRVGSIMHYPEVEGLQDIVITDLQLVFERITQLITSSFTFEATGNAAIVKEFTTTGRFTESHLRTLSSRKGDPLTPLRLVTLLKHLHIVAGPMELKHGHRKNKYYFMPCALKPTSVEEEHQDKSLSPVSLLIYFECGYNPVGVFCCLVVHLLSSTSQTEVKWTLEKPPHYRNKIIFTVGECCDHIILISRATYLEVWIDRISGTTGAIPLEQLCPTIYNTLDNGIKVITESLHYAYKSQHFFGFPCTACQSSPPHPVICKSSHPVVAQCVNGRVRIPLEEKHKIWFNKVSLSNKCKIIINLFVIGYHITN